jgi:phosphoribosylformylglycinamidine synthase
VATACDFLKLPHKYLWWADHFTPEEYSAFILPGGFSYGDYLRAGAIAARSPAMDDVREAAKRGQPILGICNGFQILCESELLPGVLTKNISQNFQDEWVDLEVVNAAFWGRTQTGKLKLPIAHSLGRFFAPDDILDRLFDQDQVWLKYTANPNGSLRDVAGINNEAGNVSALMPHPERAMEEWMGGRDGRAILEVLINAK